MKILSRWIEGKDNVLLYLSSGTYSDDFMSLPFDAVILVDQHHRRHCCEGNVLRLALDNNAALRMLAACQVQVGAVLAVNDGCTEGGNYECAYGHVAMGRLYPIMKSPCLWITDHRKSWKRRPFRAVELETPRWVSNLTSLRDRASTLSTSTLIWNARPIVTLHSSKRCLRIIHDSVWSHLPAVDTLLVPTGISETRGFRAYVDPERNPDPRFPFVGLEGLGLPRIVVMGDPPVKSIKNLIQKAGERGSKHIGVLPAFSIHSRNIVFEILESDFENIETIDFFYMNRADYGWCRGK